MHYFGVGRLGSDMGRLGALSRKRGSSSPPPTSFATTFDLTTAAYLNSTLTNSNKTVVPVTAGAWQTVRSSTWKRSGKWYIEFKCAVAPTDVGANYAFGLVAPNETSYPGFPLGTNGVANLGASGGVFVGGGGIQVTAGFTAGTGTGPTFVIGDVIGIAVDFNAGKFWLAKNNVNIGTGDPVAGTNPQMTFVGHDVGELAAGVSEFGPTDGTWTIQAAAASQIYSAPSGYAVWGDEGFNRSASDIVFVGDSVPYGVGSPNPYPRILKYVYGVGISCITIPGVGYAWNDAGVKTTPNLISIASQYIDPLKTNPIPWLVLAGGLNDLNFGDTAAQAYASFQTFIAARLAAGWPANKIIVMTIIPHSPVEAARETFNASLVSGASTYGYSLARLDLDPTIGAPGTDSNATYYNQTGGTAGHPTDAGHQLIANVLGPVINPSQAISVLGPGDAAAGGFWTVQDGQLTATLQTDPTGWLALRAGSAKSSGKWYVEFKCTYPGTGARYGFGFADATFAAGTPNNYLGAVTYSGGVYAHDGTHVSTGFTAGTGNPADVAAALGDVFGLLIDFSAQKIWLAKNNLNVSSGSAPNPSTDTAQLTFVGATTGALFPAIACLLASSGTWTLQSTAVSQTYSPPSGFSAWG